LIGVVDFASESDVMARVSLMEYSITKQEIRIEADTQIIDM
jgi:hypothetical protein